MVILDSRCPLSLDCRDENVRETLCGTRNADNRPNDDNDERGEAEEVLSGGNAAENIYGGAVAR